MKDSFILYADQKEVINMLTDSQAGKLLKAIYEYETTGNIVELPNTLKLIFIPIKQSLDRNKQKYEKIVERNKENIKSRWNKNNTKNTTGKNGIPKDTKNTDNDNDNDSDPELDSDIEDDNIISLYNKIGIFSGNTDFLDDQNYKKQVILYKNIVSELYKSKNIEVLNNLTLKKLDLAYEKIKGKDIDDEVNYMKVMLINETMGGKINDI